MAVSAVARQAPHREPAADALGDRHQVRRDTGPLMGEQLAGTADTGLDLVEDQQKAVVVAELAHCTQELGRDFADTALTLDRLDADRCGLRPDGRLQGVQVIGRHLVETGRLRTETLQVLRLAAGRDGRDGTAVEGPFESDDVEAIRLAIVVMVAARALDRRFHGFRAGIHEQDLFGESRVAQPLRQPLAIRDLVQIGGVPELGGLILQCLDQMRVAVTEGIDRDAGSAIEESSAVSRYQPDAFPVIERQVRSCVISE